MLMKYIENLMKYVKVIRKTELLYQTHLILLFVELQVIFIQDITTEHYHFSYFLIVITKIWKFWKGNIE